MDRNLLYHPHDDVVLLMMNDDLLDGADGNGRILQMELLLLGCMCTIESATNSECQ
jgi:hypothetical protein